ncbi:hypothetical protein EDM80_09990 [bacterium]|nr:MAG: hypothetical protein EDM80_09990 [bacterium]RIK64408.1 MAG: hypothetical protein DCC64_04535 [Planctomycetota bacterium]
MAKKPPPAGKVPPPGAAGAPAQNEAVGKFDKFALFGLTLPATLLALTALVLAVSYTHQHMDTGFLGFLPGPKKITDYESAGPKGLNKPDNVHIIGLESQNYIGRLQEGDVDVAVLDAGSRHGVQLGDVFTVKAQGDAAVRLEFVVFDLQRDTSRAYILLGQDVSASNGERKHSLALSSMKTLIGATEGALNVEVQRKWADQIVRRYVEARSNKP